MKYFVEYYTWKRTGSKSNEWGIVEFAFRSEISRESIRGQLVPEFRGTIHVTNMVKL